MTVVEDWKSPPKHQWSLIEEDGTTTKLNWDTKDGKPPLGIKSTMKVRLEGKMPELSCC